jgi:peptide/nickel transport system permease protein
VSYIIRRVFSGLLILFALTWITFALFWLLPAQPWRAIVSNPVPTKAEIAAANHQLGVDRPVYVQYGKFVWGIVRHGSFGRDYYQNEPVTTFLKQALPVTWSIVLGGVILLFFLALPLATVSALWANTAVDRIILTLTIAGVALHPFIIGIGLRGLFAHRLHLLPAYYYCPLRGTAQLSTLDPGTFTYKYTTCGGVGGWSSHLVLPWLTFAVIFLPLYVRMLRGAIVEVLDSPYILTAHAKGAGTLRVLRSHVFRNAMLQPLTMIGMEIGLALTVSIYIESMYTLHGAGQLAIGSLGYASGIAIGGAGASGGGVAGGNPGGQFDLPILVGVVFMIALTVIVLNLIVDVTYAMLDPRIRLSGRSVEATG